MKRQFVLEKWNEFSQTVLPPNCSETQRVEMRRSFYAGAISLWNTLFANLHPGTEPGPTDLVMMDDLKDEFDEYRKRLQAEGGAE